MPTVDESKFKLPSDQDFYVNAIDDTYIKMINDKITAAEQAAQDSTDLSDKDTTAQAEILKTAFYTETPAVTALGYHEDKGVYFIKVNVDLNEKVQAIGGVDGDTLPCTLADAGDTTTQNFIDTNVKAVLKELTGDTERFGVRLLGIDAPEIYHYSFEKIDLSKEDITTKNFADIVNDTSYIYERAEDLAETSGSFIKPNKMTNWLRYTVISGPDGNGLTYIKMVNTAGQHKFSIPAYPTGVKAQKAVVTAINMAGGEIYAMLDANYLNMSNDRYPTLFSGNPFSSDIGQCMKVFADKLLDYNDYIYTYYSQWGVDAYGRFLGAIYLKVNGTWINLAKYVIAACSDTNDIVILPSYSDSPSSKSNNNYVSNTFGLWTYDFKDRNYADAVTDTTAQFDDREDIQNKIFGKSLSDLKTWSVMIGDNMFLVPPTSIKCVTRTTSERVPVMRARGTMAKSAEKAEKILELSLYFDGDKGINGIPIECEEAKKGGEKVTYYFNSLRSLIAMFKFTPFLPIENDYINKVLAIDAVSLYNIKVNTVPGYPKLLSVDLQLVEFNYRVYMPELPINFSSTTFTNYFSAGINFKTMRYYYQRAILRGNLAAVKPEVLDKGEKVKTQLKPMDFKSSLIKFEIADEDQLKKKLQAYQMAVTKPVAKLVLTDVEKKLAKDIGNILTSIEKVQASDEYKAILEDTNNGTLQKKKYGVMNIAALMRGISNVASVTTDSSVGIKPTDIAYSASIILTTNFDYVTSESDYANLKKAASPTVGVTVGNFFNNGVIKIPYNISGANIELDTSSDYDLVFAGYCATVGDTTTNEDIQNIKNATDWERFDSLKYNSWDAGDIIANNFSVALGNTISKISVSGTDGYAPQFLGGQDTVINLSFMTRNQLTVSMVKLLPKVCAYLMRTYRQVITAAPIRISSELTDFFSVKEVTIESVDAETVDGVPGLYKIDMSLKSIDRTVRNKEALHRIEGTDQGTLNSSDRTKINVDSYFDLNSKLQEVELYPDLELPTLDELNQKNFYFIRYVNDNNRKYVDPDFYFIYAHLLNCSVYREAILNAVKQDTDDYVMTDSSGGEVTLKTEDGKLSLDKTKDTQVFRTIEDAKKFKDNNGTVVNDKMSKLNKKLDTLEQSTQYWVVGPNITCSFLEKEYAAQLQNHVDNANSGNTEAEGAWAATTGKSSAECATAILEYLKENPVSTDGLTATVKGRYRDSFEITSIETSKILTVLETRIKNFFSRSVIINLLKQINMDATNTKFLISTINIIEACACAATGKTEYSGIMDSDWSYRNNFYLTSSGSGDTSLDDVEPETITEFGPYRIKVLSRGEYNLLTGESTDTSNYYDQYFLDPYYNAASAEDKKLYKENCVSSAMFATEAFCRLTLFWLAKMLQQNIVPSITLSMLRGDVKKEIDNLNIIDKNLNITDDLLKQYKAIIDSSNSFDAGIMFLSAIAAVTNGDEQIMSLYRKRDYNSLKQATRACSGPARKVDPKDISGIRLRKTILALVGLGEIKDFSKLGLGTAKEQNDDLVKNIEQAYIAAADNPKQYWMDSFLDMIQYDHRGRMLRAFPVFYILLIDEGRSYGQWKLHDNFYNTASIMEMEITKSRKNPADVAHIVMTNVYGSYSTTDEDSNTIYDTDYTDLVTSIFSPKTLYNREEARRSLANPVEQTKLTPGIRTHIRLGYGANAVTLPVVFNGVIAEVKPGETIDLVCQGDGIELMNPVLENQDMYAMLDQDLAFGVNILDNGATPKEIMNTMLTAKGGWWNKQIAASDTPVSYMFKKNPYGIVHFGDADYTDIFKSGEPTQNIYEVTDKPINSGINWGQNTATDATFTNSIKGFSLSDYDKSDNDRGPKLTFDIFGKTTWDIFNTCKAADPDFILGIAPFAFRSTVFMGRPRYYCAYDYTKANETITEKRKPYQQYHIYTSYGDIIKNGIFASSKNVKTCATGTYTRKESFGTSTKQKVGPMWADIEIYPENQKSMIVDTALVGEGVPIVGELPFVNTIVDRFSDDKGVVQSPYRVAWKMTASALKQSMMDMYTGEMIVIGDPTVKPHDRIFINDAYENMGGQAAVKEVVQMISVNNGFTTAIVPDIIVTVDDKCEIANQTFGSKVASIALSAVGSNLLTATMYGAGYAFTGKGFVPTTTMVTKGLSGISSAATKTAETIASAGAEEGIIAKAAGVLAKIAGTAEKVGAVAAAGALTITALPALLTIALETAVMSIATNTLASCFERYAENLQVVQVFPLKRNGKTMTAGMLGSKGAIYGSPSYNNPGLIKGIFANIASPDNPVAKVFASLFVPDNLKAIGDRYKRDAKIIDDQGNSITDEKASNNICQSVLAANAYNLTGYEKFLLQPRITTKKEMADAYSSNAITDVGDIESNQRIAKENIMVSRSDDIKPYIDNNFFRIVQEEASFNNDDALPMKQNIDGEVVQFKAIVDKDAKGNTVYDVPFLKQDAISVLAEILDRTYKACPSINTSDSNDRKTGSFVILKSALRLGDQSTAASMGFSFVISGLGECTNAMNTVVKQMITDIKETADKYDTKPFVNLFAYYSIDSKTIGLTVKPPIIARDASDTSATYSTDS